MAIEKDSQDPNNKTCPEHDFQSFSTGFTIPPGEVNNHAFALLYCRKCACTRKVLVEWK